MLHRIFAAWLIAFIPSVAVADDAARERIQSALAPYLGDDALVVAAAEIDSRWIAGLQQVIIKHGNGRGDAVANQPGFAMARGVAEGVRAAGGRELVLLVGLHDLSPQTGPIVILTNKTPETATELAALVRSLAEMRPDSRGNMLVEPHEGNVLIGQAASLERYKTAAAQPRADLLDPLLAAFGDGDNAEQAQAALVAAPGDEARRVIRALWPELPPPFAGLNGSVLADDIEHVTARLASPPEWRASLVVSMRNDQAAGVVKKWLDNAWRQMEDAATRTQAEPQMLDLLQRASQVLAAEQRGTTVSVRAAHDQPAMDELLAGIVLPSIGDARADAYRKRQIIKFKQMALAMHNFHDATGAFPASAAIVSAEGKPLLSWRVAVLPYLEEGELFRQFRLDEPWDSPHNQKLVAKIPDVYTAPQHRDLAAKGKTTYQTPVHPQSAFPPLGEEVEIKEHSLLGESFHLAAGVTFRDIRDGTSNTMMIVEVPAAQAVVWTKPADWEVDLAQAWQQLRAGSEDGYTITSFCDGHAKAWNHRRDKITELVPKSITRDGGEIIDWNQR